MVGIIVTGHGNFGSGLASSVQLIAGAQENFIVVDFVQEFSIEDLMSHLNKAVDDLSGCEGIIVFSDLVGGSPFKTAVEMSMTRDEKIVVLSGTNLGMLLEASMARGFIDDVDMLADMTVNTGKDQVMKYVFVERQEEETEDGI